MNIIKRFFWIYSDDHIIFFLKSDNCTDRLFITEIFFPSWVNIPGHDLLISHTVGFEQAIFYLYLHMWVKYTHNFLYYMCYEKRFCVSHTISWLKILRVVVIHFSASFPIGKLFSWPMFCSYKLNETFIYICICKICVSGYWGIISWQ